MEERASAPPAQRSRTPAGDPVFVREKQIPCFARNDSKKNQGNNKNTATTTNAVLAPLLLAEPFGVAGGAVEVRGGFEELELAGEGGLLGTVEDGFCLGVGEGLEGAGGLQGLA